MSRAAVRRHRRPAAVLTRPRRQFDGIAGLSMIVERHHARNFFGKLCDDNPAMQVR